MSILYRYDHNWSEPLKLDYEFRTSILTSRNQREQRIAERIAPRRKVSSLIFGRGDSLTLIEHYLTRYMQADWVMPDFTRRLPLISTGGAVSSEIAVDGPPAWIAAGATLVLDNGTLRESVEVVSVAGDVISLAAETISDWFVGDAGSYVYPGLVGRMNQTIQTSLETNSAAEISVEFNVDPGDDHEEDTSAPLTFNGRELWLTKPNWLEKVKLDFEGFLETVDFDRGVLDHYAPVAWNRRNWKATYLGRDSDRAEELLAFWHRLKGQQGEFYMPTWQDDLSLTLGAAMGSSALVVPGTQISTLFGGSTVYKAIIALFRDGTYEAKVVSSITDNGTNTTLHLGSAWAKAVNGTTALRVCWLPVWRSATDTLTMEWLTRTVAQCQFSFAVTEDL